jgi:hypothetical protein
MTKLYSFVRTDAGRVSISNSISSWLYWGGSEIENGTRWQGSYVSNLGHAFMDDLDDSLKLLPIKCLYGFA